MKIVVNRCFGGASLSPIGVKTAVINGVPLDGYAFEHNPNIKPSNDIGDGFFVYGESEIFHKVVKDGQTFSGHLSSDIALRTHPGLVKTLEELGPKASSKLADLQIVNIPDNVAVQIEEYDGNEHIAEQHQTW
jgi:hypothetical protein